MTKRETRWQTLNNAADALQNKPEREEKTVSGEIHHLRSFCVYGANTALHCFICVLNPAFSCSDCVQLVFIAATGFSDGFILTSGAYVQPVNADAIIVHNGYCKGFMSNALHRTFAVALVARTSHAGFINEFAGTIALAANNNICFHNHSPFFLAGCYAIATSLSAPIFFHEQRHLDCFSEDK